LFYREYFEEAHTSRTQTRHLRACPDVVASY